jgi:tetratricopeptide (TPR) repeat protein
VRLAVLRCENLSEDASLDWMGRAFSELLAVQFRQSGTHVIPLSVLRSANGETGGRPAGAPGISAERQAAHLAGATRIVYCEFSATGGTLRLSTGMEDESSLRQIKRAQTAASLPGGVFRAAQDAGKALGGTGAPFPTQRVEALEAWAKALDAADADAARQNYSQALTADPDFGQGYLDWISLEAGRRDLAAAGRVIQLAQSRGAAIGEEPRARVALLDAELHQDPAGRARALETLLKLGKGDAGVYRSLSEGALSGRRYRDAVNYMQQAVALEPQNVTLLNTLGYMQAYLGDRDAASATLKRYEALQPAQANPLDSQGDVEFYFSRFADAEKLYLAAQEKDPNFLGGAELLKAAQARLATGDVQGADGIFQRYAALLEARHDSSAPIVKAQWRYLSGRRREAVGMLSAMPSAPAVLAQLAMWELQLGDSAAARRHIAQALSSGQPAQPLMVLAGLLTQGEANPAEWEARIQRVFPAPAQAPVRDLVTGYGLLFHRHYAAAVAPLRRAYDRSNPAADEGLPVLLAWAMSESRDWHGMTSLVGPTPMPAAAGISSLSFLYFPRLFYLRGLNLERQGKKEQALENYRLYLRLAGPDAEIWGEEQRARSAAGIK